MSFYRLATYMSVGSVLIPLTFSFLQRGSLHKETLLLTALLLVSLVLDVTGMTMLTFKINNYPVFHLYLTLQFLITSAIYYQHLDRKTWILFLVVCFILIDAVSLYFNGFMVLNSYATGASSIILITLALVSIYQNIKGDEYVPVHRLPIFWISFAVLFYEGGTLLLAVLANYMVVHFINAFKLSWILHNFCNIVKNLLFALALWQSYRSMKLSS